MNRFVVIFLVAFPLLPCSFVSGEEDPEIRDVAGWKVHISRKLLADQAESTNRAMQLLEAQLQEIVRVVPPAAVAELKKVPLYFSPEYPGKRPAAEFHPGADWLRNNGRDPNMVKGVEFTNVRIFEAETRRMPNFALHELAHAYHNLVLPAGFDNAELTTAFERARTSGLYDEVERRDAEGRSRVERAYAMTNPMEYFAETTEAYFARNDFYPFTRDQLRQHDPQTFRLLTKLWGLEETLAEVTDVKVPDLKITVGDQSEVDREETSGLINDHSR